MPTTSKRSYSQNNKPRQYDPPADDYDDYTYDPYYANETSDNGYEYSQKSNQYSEKSTVKPHFNSKQRT